MSIINNSKNFIFIHIPKAAGTPVALFFSKHSRYCDQELGASRWTRRSSRHIANGPS